MKASEMIIHLQELIAKYGDLPIYAQDESDGAFECYEDIIHYENDIQNARDVGIDDEDYNGPYPYEGFYLGEY